MLPVEMKDFHVLFSRLRDPRLHINILEAQACLDLLAQLLRQAERHHWRCTFMSVSLVLVGAAGKGRSSSPWLNAMLRRTSALIFAAGARFDLIYVSLTHNPSDAPSRWVVTVRE